MKIEKAKQMLETAGFAVEEREIWKNGSKVVGIAIITECSTSPVIYPEKLSENDDIIEVVKKALQNKIEGQEYFNKLTDWEFVKDNIYVGVRPLTGDDVTTKKQFLDIEQYLYVRLDEEATSNLHQKMVEEYPVEIEEVWQQARKNTKRKMISQSLAETLGIYDDGSIPLTLVTNEELTRGAGIITVPDAFKEIARLLNTDLWIIPSSVHELMVCSVDHLKFEEIKAMVIEVNSTTVSAEDFLSNSVYRYFRKLNKVALI